MKILRFDLRRIFSGLIVLIGGDVTGAVDQVLGGAGVLLAMNSSREMELEADSDAVQLLNKAKLDPATLSSILEKLEATHCKKDNKDCKETGWLSSHPGGIDRQLALEKAIRSNR